MKSAPAVLLAAAVLFGAAACGSRPPAGDLPATWVWDRDQSLIEPAAGLMNVWNGFEVREGLFAAVKTTPRFILWRRKGEKTGLTVEYILKGGPCRIRVNGARVKELNASTRPVSVEIAARLNAGYNFLEFETKAKDALWVRAVRVGPELKKGLSRRHLEAGESLTVSTGGLKGRLVFQGRGKLGVTEVSFPEGRESKKTFERRARWPGRKAVHEFEGTSPGTVTFTAESGGFDVVGHAVSPLPEAPAGPAPKPAGKPDIFIILIDACRPDHLGVYGYPRPTSPHLDRFAADAVVFENAYANASFTRSSVATLFTGLYPESHRVRVLVNGLPAHLPTIPVFLKGRGYRTALFTATGNVSETWGFTRGVDDYFPNIGEWHQGEERNIPGQFAGWLKRDGPRFAYLHFMEPHLPLTPPPPFRDMFSDPKNLAFARAAVQKYVDKNVETEPFTPEEVRSVVDNYDSAVAYIDSVVGGLLQTLKDRGLYDDSLVVVLSDHGESLYEQAFWGHGHQVYEETVRVPLLVKFPAALGLKGRVKGVVELAGAFPTILDLFGQKLKLDGKSWFPSIAAGGMDDALSVSRCFTVRGDYGLRWRDWYAILNPATGAETLYRDARPIFEKVGEGEEGVRLLFRARFLEWLARFAELGAQAVSLDLKTLPKNELENLRSLGYIK